VQTFVVGTASVHASAALCDYLDGRVGNGDVVHAAAWVVGPGHDADRDAADALNGVRSRLGVRASVETHRLGGGSDGGDEGDGGDERDDGNGGETVADPAVGLRALADRTEADELVVGVGEGGLAPGAVADLVVDRSRPVVAVPVG